MTGSLLLLAGGLLLLVAGGESLVRGATRLAVALHLPPILIGLTLVAWGTSAPELAVSISAGLDGHGEIAVGNVVGSNIFNMLFILGVSALIIPLRVHSAFIRRDIPVLLLMSAGTWILALDNSLGRWDATGLLIAWIIYTVVLLVQSFRTPLPSNDNQSSKMHGRLLPGLLITGLLVTAGLVGLGYGARLFVNGAVELATAAGIDEHLIGVTVVAVGTSLPEVFASVMAGLRGERDLAVGNILGSNLFNLFVVLGVSTLISGQTTVSAEMLTLDYPIMLATSVIVLPLLVSGLEVTRWEGALLVSLFIGYLAWLILDPAREGWVAWTALFLATALAAIQAIHAKRAVRTS